MFSQEPNGKWADGPSDSLCVGLKGEELECSKKESETGKVMGAAGVLVFWGFRAGEEALQRAPNLPRHTNK